MEDKKGTNILHSPPYGKPQRKPQISTGICIGRNTAPDHPNI